MKFHTLFGSIVSVTGLGLSIAQLHAGNVALPADVAGPAGSGSERGFNLRIVQAPLDAVVANNVVRAMKQINGTLVDATGASIPNVAAAGPNADGSYPVDVINYADDGMPFDLMDADQNILASFVPDYFPGIPNDGSNSEKFAVEVTAFLDLKVGTYTFGFSVGTDRTDVNDDDAYQVFVSANPHDYFSLKVGEFERFAPAFQAKTKNENLFSVTVPSAGVYPFRLLYWQQGRAANLQWYTVNTNTNERILINDVTNPSALVAYRKSSVARANSPYVAEVSPAPGSDGNSSSAAIEALIVDGATTVATTGVKLYLNNAQVTPQTLTKSGQRISLSYKPNSSRTDKNNLVRLEYKDSAGTTITNTWQFGIIISGGSSTTVSGQWDFDQGDMRATIGQPLQYLDGATGQTAQKTRFGTTTQLGVPDINGQSAKVMEVPGDLSNKIGYIMTHGISPNGGGTKVNQYTLIMDVYIDTTGSGAASLFQISSLNNTDDGDLFWQGNNFGQGTDGYKGRGTFTAGAWHRVVAAYDEAANPPLVTKYVDGIKQDEWTANQGLDNPRRSLQPTAVLFGDGDQDERRKMWVNSIQIRAGKISDAEAVVLGGPSATGIPTTLPAVNVAGQWDFEFGDLGATIGAPLKYLDGAGGLTETGTQYALTTDLGIPDIQGKPAKVMEVPGDLSNKIGYIMEHRIAPNGGGTKVNQYTLIMDILVDTSGPGAASLFQVSSVNNTDDGDLFWQGNNFGQGTDGYIGAGTFTAGEWHRVAAAYDEAAKTPVVTKYVDGIKQHDWTANQGLDNPRRAMQPTAILFGDGDQEVESGATETEAT